MTNDEAIKYLIRPFATSTVSYNEYLKQKEAYDLAIKALNTQESLEKKIEFLMNERPQGEWIKWNFKTFGAMGDWEYKCSNCGKVYDGEYNFCPNCGADMREEGKA